MWCLQPQTSATISLSSNLSATGMDVFICIEELICAILFLGSITNHVIRHGAGLAGRTPACHLFSNWEL